MVQLPPAQVPSEISLFAVSHDETGFEVLVPIPFDEQGRADCSAFTFTEYRVFPAVFAQYGQLVTVNVSGAALESRIIGNTIPSSPAPIVPEPVDTTPPAALPAAPAAGYVRLFPEPNTFAVQLPPNTALSSTSAYITTARGNYQVTVIPGTLPNGDPNGYIDIDFDSLPNTFNVYDSWALDLKTRPLVILPLNGPLQDWTADGVTYGVQALTWRHRKYGTGRVLDSTGQEYRYRSAAKRGDLQPGEYTLMPYTTTEPQLLIYNPLTPAPQLRVQYSPSVIIDPATYNLSDAEADTPTLDYLAWPTGNQFANATSSSNPADLLINIDGGNLRELNAYLYANGGAPAQFSMPIMDGFTAYALTFTVMTVEGAATASVTLPGGYRVTFTADACTTYDPQGAVLQTQPQSLPHRSVIINLGTDGTLETVTYERGNGSAAYWSTGAMWTSAPGVGTPGVPLFNIDPGVSVERILLTPHRSQSYPYTR